MFFMKKEMKKIFNILSKYESFFSKLETIIKLKNYEIIYENIKYNNDYLNKLSLLIKYKHKYKNGFIIFLKKNKKILINIEVKYNRENKHFCIYIDNYSFNDLLLNHLLKLTPEPINVINCFKIQHFEYIFKEFIKIINKEL